uniref:Uncharacterized protein n=1 Tax=Fagus sylvatica TaxID=28930 RepID=A0A2N9HH55_FAGSY
MRHIVGKLSTSSFQRYKVCANRSSDEGVMAPGSRGIGAVFVHSSDAKIPIKRGMLSANREFHDVAGVIIFPTHPGSRINLLRAGKTLRAKAAVREKKCVLLPARFFSNLVPVPDSRESELGLVRYGPASRVHRGVFGPFEGSFPIRIPADPDKFLAIREFHVVHGCVLFPMCPGSQINLLRVRKTLCASAATSVGKFRKFQHSLISSACFHARGRRSSRCRIPTILVSSESLRVTYFLTVQALHRGELGFARYDPANGGRRNVPYAKGSIQFLVWSTVRSNLGQTWSTLVKLGRIWSKLSKLLEMYPGLHFKGFWARRTLVGLETARSNLGQTSVNPSQTWSTLVKLGQTLGNVSRTFFLGVFDAESPRRIRPAWFGLSRFARRHSRKSRGTPIDDQFSPIRPTAYLGGNVCAKILSDPLQLGPRAKTLRQEVHFSYHTQLSDRQELLRSSRNLSQKLTPWHKEHSDGLRSQGSYLANPSSPLCKACTSLPDSQQVDLRARAHWKEDTSMHDVELSDRQEFIGRKLSDGTKNVKIRHRELGQICARTGTRFEKKRAGSKTHFFSRTAAFARRVFPARNKLIREPGCVGKIMTPATSWNSRFAESIPRLIGIFAGRVHENSSDTPTSGSHNSLVRTPIRANFISLERGRRELSDDMPHDPV